MTIFSAWVKNRQTKEYCRINMECTSKSKFIQELKQNGYSVNPDKVQTKEQYDYIIQHTNCQPWDWNPKKYIDKEVNN